MITYEEWLVSLGANLQRCRIAQALTQSAAAEQCRLDLKYYQDVEYGRRPITTRTLFRIATAMGIDVQTIIPTTDVRKDRSARMAERDPGQGGYESIAQAAALLDE